MLQRIPLRVSITGIRGKSSLVRLTQDALLDRGFSVYAKETGSQPVSYKDGTPHPIERDQRKRAVLEETIWEVKRYWPVDALVLENQAITPYTMRVFNEQYAQAQYVLLTNIRRDHQADLGRSPRRMAQNFAKSIPEGSVLISGEPKAELQRVMAKEARSRGAQFIDASPHGDYVPGLESMSVLAAFLEHAVQMPLTNGERLRLHHRRVSRLRWEPSSLPEVTWFHAAEANDVDSTWEIVQHLVRQDPRPINFVAYFRKDRTDRTQSFVGFLEDAFDRGIARRAYISGHGATTVARRLRPHAAIVVPDDPDRVSEFVSRLGHECRNEHVVTVGNAVPPWPRALATHLSAHPAIQTGEYDRPRPTSSSLAKRLRLKRRRLPDEADDEAWDQASPVAPSPSPVASTPSPRWVSN